MWGDGKWEWGGGRIDVVVRVGEEMGVGEWIGWEWVWVWVWLWVWV